MSAKRASKVDSANALLKDTSPSNAYNYSVRYVYNINYTLQYGLHLMGLEPAVPLNLEIMFIFCDAYNTNDTLWTQARGPEIWSTT